MSLMTHSLSLKPYPAETFQNKDSGLEKKKDSGLGHRALRYTSSSVYIINSKEKTIHFVLILHFLVLFKAHI